MIRMGLILGFIMSLALIFAAYPETQGASVAEAQASAAPIQGCVTREVALDQGYGVTRTETRAVCAEDSVLVQTFKSEAGDKRSHPCFCAYL